MKLEKTAKQIVDALGGSENIIHLTHCMTRLRFTLSDPEKANLNQIEIIDGVLGLADNGGVLQIIIGTNVDVMYKEIKEKYISENKGNQKKRQANYLQNILELISSTLSPVIPAIMGAAFISIMISLLNQMGVLSDKSSTYILLNNMSGAVYYFFPVLIAWSLAERLKVNTVFAIVCACFLLLPDFVVLFAEGAPKATLFGLTVKSVSYAKQIIPIFFSVIAQKYIEKFVYKFTPKVIRTMVGSGLIMILTISITILVLGPLGSLATEGINQFIYFIVDKCGWVAVPIIAFINPILLGTGLGSANFPLMLMSYVNNGFESLILPAALAGNAAQVGSGLAVAFKTKDKHLKEVATESSVTALMGITEPIIFSVHYKLKRTMFSVMLASAITAILPAIAGVACYALATGILSLPAYLPGGTFNFIIACITMLLGIVLGFIITYVIGFKDIDEEEYQGIKKVVTKENETIIKISSPIDGQIVQLSEIKDTAFSSGSLGNGIAIIPSDNHIYSPIDGEIVSLFPTNHAIGLKDKNGVEVLIHIGIDTVNIKENYFNSNVKIGDFVRIGEELISFDKEGIEKSGYELIIPIVVTNTKDFLDVFGECNKVIKTGDKIISVI